MKKLDLPKDKILEFYEKGFGAGKIAKIYGCAKRTILLRLYEWQVPMKPSGSPQVKISKRKLQELYINKRLSAQKIADMLNCGETTIFRKLKIFNIKSRDSSDSHIKYSRRSFSGNKFEKAYLVGFAMGDLRTRIGGKKDSKTLKVGCGSTKKEQVQLFKKLFEKYGRVWIGQPDKKGRINMEALLDMSFSFLLNAKIESYKIFRRQDLFNRFLAGFIDAEGSFFITKNQAEFAIGNYNFQLLRKIRNNLLKNKIDVPKLNQDKKLYVSKEGYRRKKYYWHLLIHKKDSILKLTQLIGPFLKHEKRKLDMGRIIANIERRNAKL